MGTVVKLEKPARAKQNANQKQFVEEYGKHMVANLEKLVNNSKPIVRLNESLGYRRTVGRVGLRGPLSGARARQA